jgi:hypothetical protein
MPDEGAQLTATVTDDSPLTIIADGADTANPAESLNAVAYTIGDRVQVTLRTPRQPLVTGQVATV